MDRRELLGVLGTTTAGLLAVTGRAAGAQSQEHHHSEGHEDCLKACQQCAALVQRDLRPLLRAVGPWQERARQGIAPGRRLCQVLRPVSGHGGQQQPAHGAFLRRMRRGVQGVRG